MDIKFERGFSLQQALDMIYNDNSNNVTDIYMCPPDGNALTDEDSADEDDGGIIDNLSRRQFLAKAEIRVSNIEHLSPVDETDENEKSHLYDVQPMQQNNMDTNSDFLKTLKGKKYTSRTWIDGDFIKQSEFPKPKYSEFENLSPTDSPTDLFELFFDNGMISHILEETRKYALFLNCADPNISLGELKCFLAILTVSGFNGLPGKRFYWDIGEDMSNHMIKNAMRRDRFIHIMRFLHFEDNANIKHDDKMWKLRPDFIVFRKEFITVFFKFAAIYTLQQCKHNLNSSALYFILI